MMRRYEKKRQSLPRARSLRVFARSVASLLANVTVLIEPDCWRLRLRVLLGWPDLGLRLRVRWPGEGGGVVEEVVEEVVKAVVEALWTGVTRVAACATSSTGASRHLLQQAQQLSSALISLRDADDVPKMTPPRQRTVMAAKMTMPVPNLAWDSHTPLRGRLTSR